MWVTLIAAATAASICLSVVNLASQINKVRNFRHSPVVESTAPHNAPRQEQSPGMPTRVVALPQRMIEGAP